VVRWCPGVRGARFCLFAREGCAGRWSGKEPPRTPGRTAAPVAPGRLPVSAPRSPAARDLP